LKNGAQALAVRNAGSLRFLEQLIQESKLRGSVRLVRRYVNFVERDCHADGQLGFRRETSERYSRAPQHIVYVR
jgi:hypothetical protein